MKTAKLMFAACAAVMMTMAANAAKTAKVVVEKSGKTLRFVYNDKSYGTEYTDWYSVSDAEAADPSTTPWWTYYHRLTVTRVIIDNTFSDYKPKHCGNWFAGCSELTVIEGLHNLDVSNATSLMNMFGQCPKLEWLDLSTFNTAKVTDMQSMFAYDTNLKTIYASSKFKTTALTGTGYQMFYGCTSLVGGKGTKYNVNVYDKTYARVDGGTSSPGYFSNPGVVVVEDEGATLRFVCDGGSYGTRNTDWYSVAEAEVPNAETGSPRWVTKGATVTKVIFDQSFAEYRPRLCYGWFNQFKKLAKIEGIGNLNVCAATSMKQMFQNCSALKALDLSTFNTAKVADMQQMFDDCTSLEWLDISSFNTASVTNTYMMFAGDAALKTIYGTNFTPDRIADSRYMFLNCTQLRGRKGTTYSSGHVDYWYARIDMGPDSSTPGYFSNPGAAVLANSGKTLKFVCDGQYHGVRGTDWYSVAEAQLIDLATETVPWYSSRSTVTKVVFDPSFAEYRPSQCGSWFYRFTSLKECKGLENLDTSEVTSMAYMFRDCYSLQTLDLSSFDSSVLKNTAYMFDSCGSLTTIYATETFYVGNVSDSQNMFRYCYNLVGGKGTKYNGGKVDKEYAIIDDRGEDEVYPGYFTAPGQAVVEDGGDTLRFVCDGQNYGVRGKDWFSVVEAEANSPTVVPPWYAACTGTVSTVVFDVTFTNCRPKSCGCWFQDFKSLTDIEHIENLDVSACANLFGMFSGCTALETLDLSTFNTAQAQYIAYMFENCSSLRTIYASKNFVTTGVLSPLDPVFTGCVNLVGGKGTAYDQWKVNGSYARFDGGPDSQTPGYFTMPGVAVVEDEGATLRFVCDGGNHGVKNVDWFSVPESEAIDPNQDDATWYEACHEDTVKVVFDPSFADYHPTRCGSWFCNFNQLTTIEGIENLDTSEATSMAFMFGWCGSLTELDLSTFNTAKVTDMNNMFSYCDDLKTIYASKLFTTDALDDAGAEMFTGCVNLVGGNHFAYDPQCVSAAYACIDSDADPGYFTKVPGYGAWAASKGLTGADAAWDAKPAIWGGKWENAFIYTFGEGLADGSISIMSISFDADGRPVITTSPIVEDHTEFYPDVIGAPTLDDWSDPISLENWSGTSSMEWRLPVGVDANFFKVRIME